MKCILKIVTVLVILSESQLVYPDSGTQTYTLGDAGPAGGIVFYVSDYGVHGLEAAPADLDIAEWGCVGEEIAGAEGVLVGTGARNTAEIISGCSEPGTAARLADSYSLNGFDDWFLPSRDELTLLLSSKELIGGFNHYYYWSSSQAETSEAWMQTKRPGKQRVEIKCDMLGVRVVRAF